MSAGRFDLFGITLPLKLVIRLLLFISTIYASLTQMMRFYGISLLRLLVSAALLSVSYAQALQQDEVCVQRCFEALSGMEFSGTSFFTDGYYVDQCTNLLRI
jgi:hypothetical protein